MARKRRQIYIPSPLLIKPVPEIHQRNGGAQYTISGIGGKGKTALVMETVKRAAHLFPGGILLGRSSVNRYQLLTIFEVLFPDDVQLKTRSLVDCDINSGCKLFVENLDVDVREKMEKEENNKLLLRKLVTRVDGHPLILTTLALQITGGHCHEHYRTMLVNERYTKNKKK